MGGAATKQAVPRVEFWPTESVRLSGWKGVSARYLAAWLSEHDPDSKASALVERLADARALGEFAIRVPTEEIGEPEVGVTPEPSATLRDLIGALRGRGAVYWHPFCSAMQAASPPSTDGRQRLSQGRRLTADEKNCVNAIVGISKSFIDA